MSSLEWGWRIRFCCPCYQHFKGHFLYTSKGTKMAIYSNNVQCFEVFEGAGLIVVWQGLWARGSADERVVIGHA